MVDACLDLQQLSDYLAGKILPELEQEIEQHLAECSACQALALEYSSRSADSLLHAIRQSAQNPSGTPDPHLAFAMAAIAGIDLAATTANKAGDTGRLIRDYELQKKLGEGGMGAVYLATHTRLKKQVAIKLLKADRVGDSGAIARFAIEMEAVGKLEHPHIVRALDAGEEDGIHFLVMEYLAGIDIARLARGLGRLTLSDTCEIIRQAALGLHHAHENEVIHRDVKPSNLILLPTGKVKVLDLGLAHLRPALRDLEGLTRDNHVLGTLYYVAPEQMTAGGKVDSRSDIFSLGVTLYELLLGRVPLRKGLAVQISAEEQATRPDVPPDIWQLAAQMTAAQRDERPESMASVAEALRPWTIGSNLPDLLQQLAGFTSIQIEFPLRAPSAVSDTLGSNPPVGSSTQGESMAAPPADSTARALASLRWSADASWSRSPQRLLWIMGSGMALLALLLAGMIVRELMPGDDEAGKGAPPPPSPPVTGIVDVQCGDHTYRSLVESILEQSAVSAVDEHKRRHALTLGENKLPPGDYLLDGSAGDYQLLAQTFTVRADTRIVVTPQVDLKFPWLYPQIPTKAGDYCDYDGTLWYPALGGPREEKALKFQLTLSIHGEQMVEGDRCRWLKVAVEDQTNAIEETAWLLIKEKDWQLRQHLSIEQGWIQIDSAAVRDAVAYALPGEASFPLVAEFDRDRDTLSEMCAKLGLNLPEGRVTIHEVLVLLFGDKAEGAPPLIRQLRASLPTTRRFSLETVATPWGSRQGLNMHAESTFEVPDPAVAAAVINSFVPSNAKLPAKPPTPAKTEKPAKASVLLTRCESIPFSFALVKVDSPIFYGLVKLNSFSRPGDDVPAEPVPLATLGESKGKLEEALSVTRTPWVLPSLPRTNDTGVTYKGGVTMPQARLLYRAEINMRGAQLVERMPHRWVKITVESGLSGLDHKETALLLIDESKYSAGEFEIDHGWFLCEGQVFDFERSGDMRDVELALRRLNKPLPPLRLSVQDVLALMFGARLGSARFNGIRAEFADAVLRDGRERRQSLGRFVLPQNRETTSAEIWELDPLPGASGGSYKIVRCPRIPFDFAQVRVTSSQGVTLTADLESITKAPAVVPPHHEELATLANATDKQVALAASKQPNWRMWTLKDAPTRMWAEYGGKAGGMVLLGDEFGKIRSVSITDLLDKEDREFLEVGRQWHGIGPEEQPLFRGELVRSDRYSLRFELTEKGTPVTKRRSDFSSQDRKFIDKLITMLPQTQPDVLPPPAKPKAVVPRPGAYRTR